MEKIEKRIEELNILLDEVKTQNEKEVIQERISKLLGGICVIKVGAYTEIEMKARKFKLEYDLFILRRHERECEYLHLCCFFILLPGEILKGTNGLQNRVMVLRNENQKTGMKKKQIQHF